MNPRALAILVLCSAAASAPCLAQPARSLTPVAAQELDKFVGTTLYGRARVNLGIVTGVNRERGTIKVVAWQGEHATIPVSLLGRAGLQLRAPAVMLADVAHASYGGQSRRPLTGEVTVTEDEASTNSVQ